MEIHVLPAHETAKVVLDTEAGVIRIEDDYDHEETRIIVGQECVFSQIWQMTTKTTGEIR